MHGLRVVVVRTNTANTYDSQYFGEAIPATPCSSLYNFYFLLRKHAAKKVRILQYRPGSEVCKHIGSLRIDLASRSEVMWEVPERPVWHILT